MENTKESGKFDFDNTSVIITDPCYFTHKIENGFADIDEWDKCDYGEHMERLGFTKFMTLRTGFGDGDWDVINKKNGQRLGQIWADSGQTGIYLFDEAFNFNPNATVLQGQKGSVVLKNFTGEISWHYRVRQFDWQGETFESRYLIIDAYGKCGDEEIEFSVDFGNVAEPEWQTKNENK